MVTHSRSQSFKWWYWELAQARETSDSKCTEVSILVALCSFPGPLPV